MKNFTKKWDKNCRYKGCSTIKNISQHGTLPINIYFKRISQHHFFKIFQNLTIFDKKLSKINQNWSFAAPFFAAKSYILDVCSTLFRIRSTSTLQQEREKKDHKNAVLRGVGKVFYYLYPPRCGAAKSKNRQNFEHPKGKVGVEIIPNRQNFNTHFTAASPPGNEGNFRFLCVWSKTTCVFVRFCDRPWGKVFFDFYVVEYRLYFISFHTWNIDLFQNVMKNYSS